MSEGKRPGGLTALAVLNFIGGGIMTLAAVGMLFFVAVVSGSVELPDNDAQQQMAKAWQDMAWLFYVVTVSTVLSAFLLIASGVGYLKQSKFWGRTLGNVWAVLSIGTNITQALAVAEEAGGGFTIGTMIMIVYPALTLILLNTTFKEDFVR